MVILLTTIIVAREPHLTLGKGLSVSDESISSAYTLEKNRRHIPTTEELWGQFIIEDDDEKMIIQAEILVQIESKDWPNKYRGDFLCDIAPAALMSAKKNQIYPSVVLAQGILESGWGRSNLAQEHNNLFGVKGRKGNRSVQINTLETVRGRVVRQKAFFRHFDTWRESIAYPGRLLGSSHYYVFAKPIAEDAKHYLQLIAPRYASQPDYANYVVTIIDEYRLSRWAPHLPLFQDRKTD